MADLLDDLINKAFPSRSSIFNLVDDYTLFCHYLGHEVVINQPMLSPLRVSKADTLPSFAVFPGRNGELRYHDHGTGEGGSVLDFIQTLYGYKTLEEVYARVSEDFGLDVAAGTADPAKQIYLKPGDYSRIGIKDVIPFDEFTVEGANYWHEYHLNAGILQEYNVDQVKWIILDNGKMIRPLKLAFSYRIGNKLKIYQPHELEMKFRNNYPRNYVEGYYQLVQRIKKNQQSKILFITKSTKDVMCFRRMGLDAIAAKAENMVIPDFILDYLKTIYPFIFVVFDDDPAGRKGITRYPFPALWIPLEDAVKDTADYVKKYGPEKGKELIKQLVIQYNNVLAWNSKID